MHFRSCLAHTLQKPANQSAYLGVTSNFKKDPLEGFLIISHKNHRIPYLKRLLSEKPKIIGIRQIFVMLGVFLVWGASDVKHFAEEM